MKIKKFLAAMLAVCMTASMGAMLASCGGSSNNDSDKGSDSGSEKVSGDITFLTNRTDLDTDGTYEKYIADFNKKYPDVKVTVESAKDYAGELATRMQTTEYGDVLMIPDAVPSKEYSKYFLPFGTVDELKDKYRENYLYSKWYDGQVYGLAYMCTVQGIVYNKAIFEQAGIKELPKSADEFLNDLKLIKEKTKAIPYYTNANAGWTLDQWEDHTNGTLTGDAEYKNNKLPTDKNAFAEGSSHYQTAKLLYDIVKEGLCEEDPTTGNWEKSKKMLNDGEIATMVLGNWAVSQIKEASSHPDDVGYMPFPATVNGKQYATSGTDYCYAVNKNTKSPEAAKAFIDFMINDTDLCEKGGGISLVKDSKMPSGLENFENVEFVVDKPATTENLGKYDQIQKDAGITLYDNGARMNEIVNIARGASKQTFEDYMKSLNDKWAKAVK